MAGLQNPVADISQGLLYYPQRVICVDPNGNALTSYTENASLTAGALNADLVASLDVTSYKSLSLQITGTWSGTITFQGSNDNSNWVSIRLQDVNAVGPVSTTTSNSIFTGPVRFRYLRCRMTSYTSGTATGTLELYSQSFPENMGTVTQSGTWTVQPGNTANTTAWLVTPQATTSGGSTPSHTISAASTNATSTKASAGNLYGVNLANTNASVRYVKFYDKASAPTVGTDTPIHTFMVPANSIIERLFPEGLSFSNGIAWGTTTGVANSDTGAVGANDLVIDFNYK